VFVIVRAVDGLRFLLGIKLLCQVKMVVIRHADYGCQKTNTRRIRFRAANTQNLVTAINVRMCSMP